LLRAPTIRDSSRYATEIHLSELQKTLDAQGIEIVENQKESVVGRKNLSDRTKEYKKIPEEEKLNAWKSLLKGTYP
jgi:homeobox protein cut-like